MIITLELLKEKNACEEGISWVKDHKMIGLPVAQFVNRLIIAKKLDWGNWLIVRCITHDQQIMYAIYAAEKVIGICETKYPDDDRPRKAIEAAKAYLKDKTQENKDAAYAAARAAYDAARAAYAAVDAAADAAVDAAARAAYDAARAAYAAADAAARAAYAAADAAYAAALKDIIRHGLTLLK